MTASMRATRLHYLGREVLVQKKLLPT